jgi:nicotinate-nucleotide pyrophosphorylase (carboxylating)
MAKTPVMDEGTRELIRMAVREDLGSGDKTVALAIPARQFGVGRIVARKAGVICGTYLIETILRAYGGGMKVKVLARNGMKVKAGAEVARISGRARTILSAERVVLNFLGHMSGVATTTRLYVDAVKGTKAVICDTRKTTPGFRMLDKYAVRCGGGVNHRMGLYDGVMLKDNHLAALREELGKGATLAELTRRIRGELDFMAQRPAPSQTAGFTRSRSHITLWLEVDTLQQLGNALGGGAEIILLDNFSVSQMRRAVELRDQKKGRELLEASGGITLENVAAVAKTGVDRISIGALTHSAPVLDLSMEME